MDKSLAGKAALVTGCARINGLGRAIATALAHAGADVAVCDVDPEGTRNVHEGGEDELSAGWRGLPSLVEELGEIGVTATAVVGDVGNGTEAQRMVTEAVDALGRVDVLVNNAAAPHGPDRNWSWLVAQEAFEAVMRVNATGTFLMSSAVARHLLDRGAPGRIINISSGTGRRGYPQRAAYSASKFAVVGLTQAMAAELAPHKITVNAVCPGAVATARQLHTRAAPPSAPGADAPIPAIPVGRMGVPGDVARAVLFLAEPDADYVTGECLNVNGGVLMY